MKQLSSLLSIERNIPIEIYPENEKITEPSRKGLIKSMPMPTTSGTYDCQYAVLGAQLPVWVRFKVYENKESKIISQTAIYTELQKPTQLEKNKIEQRDTNKAQSFFSFKSYKLMSESELDYILGLDTFLTKNKEKNKEQFIEQKLEIDEYDCKIKLFKQNKKTKELEEKTDLIPYIGRSDKRFYIRYKNHSKMKEVVLLQLKQKNQEPITIFFPQMEWSPFFVISVKRKKENEEWKKIIQVDWIFPEEAALALGYFQEMKLSQAELILKFMMGNNSDNESTFNTQDPLTLVCFGYLFLKLFSLENVKKISDHLIKNFNWLPDSFIIHATLLKRTGQFTQAIETLIEGFSKGPPISSMGLGFTQEILGPIYTPGYPKLPQPTIDIVDNFYTILISLQPYRVERNYSLGLAMPESKLNTLLEKLDKSLDYKSLDNSLDLPFLLNDLSVNLGLFTKFFKRSVAKRSVAKRSVAKSFSIFSEVIFLILCLIVFFTIAVLITSTVNFILLNGALILYAILVIWFLTVASNMISMINLLLSGDPNGFKDTDRSQDDIVIKVEKSFDKSLTSINGSSSEE